MRFLSLTAITGILLSACVSLQSVSLTQVPLQRSKKIKAESNKMIFFALSFDNDYVDKVSDNLKEQCPGGKVQGILTKDELTNYFLGLVIKRSITATGYCNKA